MKMVNSARRIQGCLFGQCRGRKNHPREAVFIGELRTMPQGHPDYRFIVQEMWRKIQEVHPTLAECGKFIDWKTYRLGRLQSEMRTEYKKSALDKP